MGPVLVIATHQRWASPSSPRRRCRFLGVGVPPTQPSLGTLIRIGNDFLFSGEWWITIFPGVMLVAARAGGEPAGRLAARRAQPEAALMAMPTPLLRGQEPARRVPDAPRHAARARRRLVRHRAGRGAGRGRRIGRRQVADRRGHHRPARAAGAHRRRRDPARRPAHRQPAATRRCARIRGRQIGAIFQDPLTSLNPLYTIGRQLIETIQTHLPVERRRGARARASRCCRRSASRPPRRASTTIRTSSPAACASAW